MRKYILSSSVRYSQIYMTAKKYCVILRRVTSRPSVTWKAYNKLLYIIFVIYYISTVVISMSMADYSSIVKFTSLLYFITVIYFLKQNRIERTNIYFIDPSIVKKCLETLRNWTFRKHSYRHSMSIISIYPKEMYSM